LEIKYNLKEVDLKTGKMVVELMVKIKTYTDINLNEIKKAISGESIQEAGFFLRSLAPLDRVELDKGSFMRRTVPENMDKIKVELMLD